MRQKKAITKELRDRYQRLSKKEKIIMLNEFIRLTGYNRSYAARALRIKRLLGYLNIAGKRIKYVADRKTKREKKRFYDKEVFMVLKKIWIICDYICSKRLAPFLEEVIPVLEKHGVNLPRFIGQQDKTIINLMEVQVTWKERKDTLLRNLRKRQ